MWSVKQLQGLVKEQYDRSVSACTVLDILKNKFQLSYRKIKRVPFAGNSERSKVLRSLYAQKMLTVYQSGKRVINVDESWIPHADFRQRRWKRRGMANSAQDKTLSQKINIITAMSSDGEVWIALTTCNTDSDVLMLFMTRLASALTKQAAAWRSSTVFLLDGVRKRAELLTCDPSVGIVPQVGGEPCLLQAPRAEHCSQRCVQLCSRSSRTLVRSPQARRHQPHERRLGQAVSALAALTRAVLSRTSPRSCTRKWKRSPVRLA